MSMIRKCPSAFVETDIDDEKVLMSLEGGEFFSLKGTALATWELIDGERDRDGLAAELATRYAASEETVGPDIDSFLAELQSAGLIDQS